MSECGTCYIMDCHARACSCSCHMMIEAAIETLRNAIADVEVDIDHAYLEYPDPDPEVVKCKIHRGYKVKRKPTGNCEDCWKMWLKGKI